MTQINLIVNSLPRDLLEFTFFLAVGFTAGSIGLIWVESIKLIYLVEVNFSYYLIFSSNILQTM